MDNGLSKVQFQVTLCFNKEHIVRITIYIPLSTHNAQPVGNMYIVKISM